jgi:hypothetical protein
MKHVVVSAASIMFGFVACTPGCSSPTPSGSEATTVPQQTVVGPSPVTDPVLQPPSFSLLPLPSVQFAPEPELSAKEVDEIKQLIKKLSEIDSPDLGLSSTSSGSAFAPIASANSTGVFLFTDHALKQNPALLKLVELGPKALPHLLEALTDQTPTNLTINNSFEMGAMRLDHEIGWNPMNPGEAKVFHSVTGYFSREDPGEHIQTYRVRIGDVCFVIIGQITNRRYSAVLYHPTARIVVNSTTKDNKLATEVRSIWKTDDIKGKFLNHLLIDYSTRCDSSDVGQVGAAMRLAYFFPSETSELIADRIKRFDVTTLPGEARQRANGVREVDFLTAVAWSPDARIKRELFEVFKKTTQSEILLAALPAVDKEHDELVFNRLLEFLNALPDEEIGPFGDGYNLLIALGKRLPERAEPIFRAYSQRGGLQRRRTMCHALRETGRSVAVQLLLPLLKDKTKTGWDYPIIPEENEPRLPVRVCDEAAATISMNFKDLPFRTEGTHEDLDRQIETMIRLIESGNPGT